jgi:16S rRNA (adenine1518-N6/adenine1519-N6)-dimethyltransferase
MIKGQKLEKSYRQNFNQNLKKYSQILKKLGKRPSHSLGQNFLVNHRLADDQIMFANIADRDTVLEIGPGLGVLTQKLAAKAKKVIAIEFDKALYSYLKGELPGNVELICGDAIKIDFPKFDKLVSNIPYQISSPLIFKLIDYDFALAILMLQAEFANRLTAMPNTKAYSRLTVMSSYNFNIELLCTVPRENFMPVPKVDSALIEVMPKTELTRAKDEELFGELVKIFFNERRKMIKNSMASQVDKIRKFSNLQLNNEDLIKLITQFPTSTSRPEQLSLQQLIELADDLYEVLHA